MFNFLAIKKIPSGKPPGIEFGVFLMHLQWCVLQASLTMLAFQHHIADLEPVVLMARVDLDVFPELYREHHLIRGNLIDSSGLDNQKGSLRVSSFRLRELEDPRTVSVVTVLFEVSVSYVRGELVGIDGWRDVSVHQSGVVSVATSTWSTSTQQKDAEKDSRNCKILEHFHDAPPMLVVKV